MRGGRAAGIEAALLGAEADAGKPELQDIVLLLRRELAPQPDEARAAFQLVVGLLDFDVGEHGRKLLDHLVGVDDAARLGKQRCRPDVGGQHIAVAVDDVGPRGGHPAGRAARGVRVLQAELYQPPADRGIDAEEDGHGHQHAVPGLAADRLALAVHDDRAGPAFRAVPAQEA